MINIKFRLPFIFNVNDYDIRFKYLPDFLRCYKYEDKEILIDGWKFDLAYGLLYLQERKKWIKDYIPLEGIKGKTILDIGAGCGETAKFFLDNNADKVICIEPYDIAFKYLKINSLNHKILPFQTIYNNDLLYSFNYDIIKMDIEGYEMLLLEDNTLNKLDKTIMLEAHNNYLVDRFIEKGFNRIYKETKDYQLKGEIIQLHRDKGVNKNDYV